MASRFIESAIVGCTVRVFKTISTTCIAFIFFLACSLSIVLSFCLLRAVVSMSKRRRTLWSSKLMVLNPRTNYTTFNKSWRHFVSMRISRILAKEPFEDDFFSARARYPRTNVSKREILHKIILRFRWVRRRTLCGFFLFVSFIWIRLEHRQFCLLTRGKTSGSC